MEINIHETKNATPVVNSNRAQLDFSGMGPAVTRGTARNVNAPVEIAGFDFSGTARYRTVSERYLSLTPPPPTIGRRAAVCAKYCLFA